MVRDPVMTDPAVMNSLVREQDGGELGVEDPGVKDLGVEDSVVKDPAVEDSVVKGPGVEDFVVKGQEDEDSMVKNTGDSGLGNNMVRCLVDISLFCH